MGRAISASKQAAGRMLAPRALVAALVVAALCAVCVVDAMESDSELTPAQARAKIEQYKKDAENAIVDKVQTRREQVAREVKDEVNQRTVQEEKDAQAEKDMLSAKKSFEQAGLGKKVEKLKAMQQKVDNEASSLEKQTRNKQAKLAKDQAEIKVRERKQEVAEVEFATASYNQWKAKEEREAAKAIDKLNKEKEKFKIKAAEQQARAEGFKLQIDKLKADYKVREAHELKSKKDAVK